MKFHFLFLFLFIVSFKGIAQEKKLLLNQIGLPDYRRMLTADRAWAVYKDEQKSFIQVLPNDLFQLGGLNDTLTIQMDQSVNKVQAKYTANCLNCHRIQFRQWTSNDQTYFEFAAGKDNFTYEVSFEKNPKNMYTAPNFGHFESDTTIGFIRMKNQLIHYAQFPEDTSVNIGIIDFNKNGRPDDKDLLALSKDNYFYTARNAQTELLGSVKFVGVNGKNYSVNYLPIWELSYAPAPQINYPNVSYSDSLPNISFESYFLDDFFQESDYVLISRWSEFCLPCIRDIPQLNELNKTIKVVGIYNGTTDLKTISSAREIDYLNFVETKAFQSIFNFNGFPYFVLIDKQHHRLLSTHDFGLVLQFLSKER